MPAPGGADPRLDDDTHPGNGETIDVGKTIGFRVSRSFPGVGGCGGDKCPCCRSWAVIAPTTALQAHALAGKYVGATGDVSLGVGAGAKVLVGGSHQTVTLQPVSVEGRRQLGIGGCRLTLKPTI